MILVTGKLPSPISKFMLRFICMQLSNDTSNNNNTLKCTLVVTFVDVVVVVVVAIKMRITFSRYLLRFGRLIMRVIYAALNESCKLFLVVRADLGTR